VFGSPARLVLPMALIPLRLLTVFRHVVSLRYFVTTCRHFVSIIEQQHGLIPPPPTRHCPRPLPGNDAHRAVLLTQSYAILLHAVSDEEISRRQRAMAEQVRSRTE
jgi:hypothetical protein